jgi:DNA-binding beta-propeller fold protein YncE
MAILRRPGNRAVRRLASTVLALLAVCSGCAGSPRPARTDVPEPAAAGAVAGSLPGRIIELGGEPEGLALDAQTGLLAVAVRNPGAVVLIDAATGAERVRVPLGGAARHLELAGPGGPVLVPTENNDRLYRVALPGGAVIGTTAVGRQPHDAAATGARIFVGDELADTVHVIEPDGSTRVLPAPVQPGGVASAVDGSVVVAVGVRGRRIAAWSADGRRLGEAPCGVGPTHVRAGRDGLFYVADTQGGAVLVFQAGTRGIRQVGRVSTGGGAPYGLAIDAAHRRLYVTLTGRNELRSFRIDGRHLRADRSWPTVRQPNDVAVDASTGLVVVAGTAEGRLQFLDDVWR